MSVSRRHNLKNVRREREESLADLERIVAGAQRQPAEGHAAHRSSRPRPPRSAAPTRAASPVDDVRKCAALLAEAGVDEIMRRRHGRLRAIRRRCARVFTAVLAEVGDIPVAAHFHDTRGIGLANVLAALDCRRAPLRRLARRLGGCPFAPGASGNIVMEDLVLHARLDGAAHRHRPAGADLRKREILSSNLPRHRAP